MSIYDSLDLIAVCAAAITTCAVVCTVAFLVVMVRREREKK